MDREIRQPDPDTPLSAADAPDGDALSDGDVLPILLRYRDRYRWSWNLSARLINLYYGTHYTEKQLKSLYQKRDRTTHICEKVCP